MATVTLQEFADEFPFCFLCWSRSRLHIHHMVQGAGRKHERFNLARLCERCHRALHDGGSLPVTKGMLLTVKRECDPEHYNPKAMAGLQHKVGLAYDPECLPEEILVERRTPPEVFWIMNSRQKGARGEREAAAVLNEYVPHAMAKRGQQHSGTETSADLVAAGTPNLWWEVKRVQKLCLPTVMEKAKSQCGQLVPVVLHRRNDEEWLVTLPLSRIQEFARQVTSK